MSAPWLWFGASVLALMLVIGWGRTVLRDHANRRLDQ